MKSVLFAAALLCGTAAIAQDMPEATTTVDPAMTTTVAPLPHPEATSPTVQPGNTSPELDARGIPVISDPAMAPAGFNQGPTVVPAGVGGPLVDASSPPPSQPATEDYPACSRTVTDNCVQTYERQPR